MPFQSEKQRRYLHANHPEIAKRWEKEYATGGISNHFRKKYSLGEGPVMEDTESTDFISSLTQEQIDDDPERYAQLLIGLRKPDFFMGEGDNQRAYFIQSDNSRISVPWGFRGYGLSYDPTIDFKKGGIANHFKFKNGGNATKNIKGQPHMLAYITPKEAKTLENLGGQKTMTKEGIPAYPPSDNYGGSWGGSSNNNNNQGSDHGHSRFDPGSGYYGEPTTTTTSNDGDNYKDPIVEMVGKKVVIDPTTGGNIVVDENAVLMEAKKLKMSKGVRPPAWVSPEKKAFYDNLDKHIADNTGLFSSYNLEKQLASAIKSKIPFGFLLPTQYPSKNINFKSIGKYEVPPSDLGFYDPKEYPEFWPKKKDDDNEPDGDAYPPVKPVTEEIEDSYAMAGNWLQNYRDLKAKQALSASLQEKWADEREWQQETMFANSGGLANLFRVKNH